MSCSQASNWDSPLSDLPRILSTTEYIGFVKPAEWWCIAIMLAGISPLQSDVFLKVVCLRKEDPDAQAPVVSSYRRQSLVVFVGKIFSFFFGNCIKHLYGKSNKLLQLVHELHLITYRTTFYNFPIPCIRIKQFSMNVHQVSGCCRL